MSHSELRYPRLCEGLFALWGTLVCSIVVLIFDVIIDGSYIYSAIVCPIWFIIAIVRNTVRRPRWGLAAARLLIPLLTALLAAANYSVQTRIAMGNAARLIQACEQYRTVSGVYPERLSDLVPRYLNSIPRAKYCLSFGEFSYVANSQCLLIWYDVPVFGRQVYNFDTCTWKYLD